MRSLTFVEVDIDSCVHRYGEGACTAVLGVDSERKCFNSIATCAKRADLDLEPVTLRFAIGTDYLAESGIDAIASISDVSITPAVVSLGKDLGTRASVRVTFNDHPWPDTGPGFDKYVTERPYDPFKLGTFWGKFRARQPYLRGRGFRLIRGTLGQTLAQMETRHFIIDSFDGPSMDGTYTIVAKDVLKILDGDRAQAPAVSQGFLTGTLTDSGTSATLNPSGIGNLQYPASGFVAIGGKEICAFTRSGDTLTLTRGQFETEAVEHAAGDRVQLCLQYSGEDPADIIADLMENYGGVPSAYIPLAAWQSQTAAYLRRQYSALIAEPTSVSKLISELVEQAALSIWWDENAQLMRLIVLRQIPDDANRFDDENVLGGTLRITEQPNSRLSQVWTYFAQINPLRSATEADNFRSIAVTVDVEAETDYGSPAIKKIFSRWIPAGGRTVASRVNDIQLGRFRDAPRKFTFELFRYSVERPQIGLGYQIEAWPLQTDIGERDRVPMQFVKITPDADRFRVEAEELRFVEFDEEDIDNRVIIFDSDINNVNLRTTHDLLYPAPVEGDEVSIIVESGAIIGSTSTAVAAMIAGDWPTGVALTLTVRGRIQGAGGAGANASGSSPFPAGGAGGVALYTRYPIDVVLSSGEIWGGGGGGGVQSGFPPRGGGGGAGRVGGAGGAASVPAAAGSPGTSDAGGLSGASVRPNGDGGDPGEPGFSGAASAGGAAGAAIDGVSYVTETGTGDIRGPEIN